MILKTKLFGHVYAFSSLKEVLAKANEEKSGDKLAGIAAETAEERVAAKIVLSEITLEDLRNYPVVPYETDEVTRIIQDDVNESIYNEIKRMTVSELREWILDEAHTGEDIKRISRGLTSEMVAAVAKLMSNMDLIYGLKRFVSRPTAILHRGSGDTLLQTAAKPPHRRSGRHYGISFGRADLWGWGCAAGSESSR